MVRIDVLGPLRVTSGRRPADIGGQRVELLAWLVMHANRPLPIGEVSRMLGDGARHGTAPQVRIQLRRLAVALPNGVVQVDEATVRLVLTEDAVDASRFSALAAAARRHWREGRHERVAADVDGALALWRSDPYPELLRYSAAIPEIQRLRRLRLGVLEMQQELAMDDGVDFTTVSTLRHLIAAHPERLGFRLMLARALHLMDRQVDALEVLRRASADLGGIRPHND
ncbi:DNA-binding transcriptional activator of the SARP family [Ruania alba]|uniref:DNA-binding transcriptional activator of the SARP family n=2 Tax=Ruania alba TaxID=648782 RepID=A0A1H5CEA2_9MICO|nr:DNA-binding transcriptional activator of the SARP family [Ruania alba]